MTSKHEGDSPQAPGEGQKRLNAFVGRWRTEGRQLEGPVGPAADIKATEHYEWLSGGFFLVHRFEGTVGGGDASCIEITGYDAARDRYPVNTYYNNGMRNTWEYAREGDTWTLTGEWPMGGKTTRVRCSVVFEDGGRTMAGTWEQSADGAAWQTFWEVTSTKLDA